MSSTRYLLRICLATRRRAAEVSSSAEHLATEKIIIESSKQKFISAKVINSKLG